MRVRVWVVAEKIFSGAFLPLLNAQPTSSLPGSGSNAGPPPHLGTSPPPLVGIRGQTLNGQEARISPSPGDRYPIPQSACPKMGCLGEWGKKRETELGVSPSSTPKTLQQV